MLLLTGAVVAQLEGGDAAVQREVVLTAADGQFAAVVHLGEGVQTSLQTNNQPLVRFICKVINTTMYVIELILINPN